MARSMYDPKSVTSFVDEKLIPMGYTIQTIREGSLLDDFVAIAPDENHYNFVIREIYVNEWTSAYTVRRCAKLSKALLDEIDSYNG